MNLLATWKMAIIATGLFVSQLCHANEMEAVDGPNVRKMRHEDGSKSIFVRSPDNKTLTKTTYSANGPMCMLTTYKMDASGNPLSCKIKDGLGREMFKVRYGYHKVTGLLVSEQMFDCQTKRINKDTGVEQPVQIVRYLYDAEGKRSAPIVYNLLPGKTYEEVFGTKSSALESNPFNESTPLNKKENAPSPKKAR